MKRIFSTAPAHRLPGPSPVKCLCLLLAALSVLLLTACGDEDVGFTLIEDSSSTDQIAFQLVNRTGRTITLGHPLLYVRTDDTWEKVPYATDPNWTLTYTKLGTLGYATVTIPVKERYGELPEGEYQVRLDYTPIHYITEDTGRHTAGCAFSVP